jgi:hypothetical protein
MEEPGLIARHYFLAVERFTEKGRLICKAIYSSAAAKTDGIFLFSQIRNQSNWA